MNKTTLKAAIITLALTGAIGLAGCSTNDMGNMPMGDTTSSSASASSSATVSGEFNDADVMFAQMMTPHHEQAVQMSDILLAKPGVNPDVAALAEDIKAAQAPEIGTMKAWLTAWGHEDTSGGMGGMDHGGGDDGMATADEMAQFEKADTATAQRSYLEMMTKHHQGAIVMAQTEIDDGQNPDAVKLATSIVSTQQEEIAVMKDLLATL